MVSSRDEVSERCHDRNWLWGRSSLESAAHGEWWQTPAKIGKVWRFAGHVVVV
jgi:hypothetical protein